jgi:hypothetical protein
VLTIRDLCSIHPCPVAAPRSGRAGGAGGTIPERESPACRPFPGPGRSGCLGPLSIDASVLGELLVDGVDDFDHDGEVLGAGLDGDGCSRRGIPA